MSITDNHKRNRILTVLLIGVLMGALDIAIVAPTLPALQAGFGVATASSPGHSRSTCCST